MSNQQRNTLRVGLAIVTLACLFPAWSYRLDVPYGLGQLHQDTPLGWSFLALPPVPDPASVVVPVVGSVRVDTSRTAMVVFAVVCLTGLTTLSLRRGINSF